MSLTAMNNSERGEDTVCGAGGEVEKQNSEGFLYVINPTLHIEEKEVLELVEVLGVPSVHQRHAEAFSQILNERLASFN